MQRFAHYRFIRIITVAVFLGAFLFAGSVIAGKRLVAHACSTYTVSGSTTYLFDGPDGSYQAQLSLLYNSCNGDNYGQIAFTSGTAHPYTGYVYVTGGSPQHSSPDQSCNSGTCTSAGVYSPNNVAQACWNDNIPTGVELTCTSWF